MIDQRPSDGYWNGEVLSDYEFLQALIFLVGLVVTIRFIWAHILKPFGIWFMGKLFPRDPSSVEQDERLAAMKERAALIAKVKEWEPEHREKLRRELAYWEALEEDFVEKNGH